MSQKMSGQVVFVLSPWFVSACCAQERPGLVLADILGF